MDVQPDLIRAFRETYHLEVQLNDGLHSDALEKGIAAVLEAHEKAVLERAATQAESFAIGMEADHDGSDGFATTLRWWAHKMREGMPVTTAPYEPAEDDVVEVTITGVVEMWEPGPQGDFDWSVVDDVTGDEYFFRTRRKPRVRVLSRNEVTQ